MHPVNLFGFNRDSVDNRTSVDKKKCSKTMYEKVFIPSLHFLAVIIRWVEGGGGVKGNLNCLYMMNYKWAKIIPFSCFGPRLPAERTFFLRRLARLRVLETSLRSLTSKRKTFKIKKWLVFGSGLALLF